MLPRVRLTIAAHATAVNLEPTPVGRPAELVFYSRRSIYATSAPLARLSSAPRTAAADGARAGSEPWRLGDLSIAYDQCRVSVAGRPVELTVTEYEVLPVFSLRPGRVPAYDSLPLQAWSGPDAEPPKPKLVHALVKRLRRKLGDNPDRPAYILNQRGVGYRMPEQGAPSGVSTGKVRIQSRKSGESLTASEWSESPISGCAVKRVVA